LLVLFTAAPLALPIKKTLKGRKPLPTVTFASPIQCKGNHGKWRWDVKTDRSKPPVTIPADPNVSVADVGAWEPPAGKIKTRTPRACREREWFQLTGKVVLVKAEADGDLHIQLGDSIGKSKVVVVVEVPADNDEPDSDWSRIRKRVFNWSRQKFPFKTKTGHRLRLTKHPVIRVVGKAFYDAKHQKVSTPNRRRYHPHLTVWEIHPVMRLRVLREDDE
jgi:hypothetical protein